MKNKIIASIIFAFVLIALSFYPTIAEESAAVEDNRGKDLLGGLLLERSLERPVD